MAPPKFDDLGKSARDLFSKGYNFGFMKVTTETKSQDGQIEIGTGATHNIATGRLLGSVDFKYKLDKYGLSVKEKWNTDNLITTETTIQDQLAKGTKVIIESAHSPVSKMSGRIKAEYKHDKVVTDLVLDPLNKTSILSSVFAHQDYLVGGQVHLDLNQNALTRHVVGFGYQAGDIGIHAAVTDGNDFGGSVYHRVNPDFQIGATLGYTLTDKTSRFGLAALYKLDSDTEVRAKVATTSQLCIALHHNLKPGLKAIASTLINMQNFNDGGHKVGLGLEYTQ